MGKSSAFHLEEHFFLKEDQKLLEKQRELHKMRETLEALKEVSGIHDESVLRKFIELKITPETAASLALVPLIEIAWADGKIEPNEKKQVLAAAEKFGWSKNGVDYVLLQRWLEHKPSPNLLEAWLQQVGYLCAQMTADETAHFHDEIMALARAIAQADGGFLGFGRTSKPEKEMLKKLEGVFQKSCR